MNKYTTTQTYQVKNSILTFSEAPTKCIQCITKYIVSQEIYTDLKQIFSNCIVFKPHKCFHR